MARMPGRSCHSPGIDSLKRRARSRASEGCLALSALRNGVKCRRQTLSNTNSWSEAGETTSRHAAAFLTSLQHRTKLARATLKTGRAGKSPSLSFSRKKSCIAAVQRSSSTPSAIGTSSQRARAESGAASRMNTRTSLRRATARAVAPAEDGSQSLRIAWLIFGHITSLTRLGMMSSSSAPSSAAKRSLIHCRLSSVWPPSSGSHPIVSLRTCGARRRGSDIATHASRYDFGNRARHCIMRLWIALRSRNSRRTSEKRSSA
mmetsp:Transcript_63077/g.150509  ORF Transcript_63077/g.150509 Transcript_63077/m.150509 type:complete len:261 (-) Transcript_63077:1219-2001(-)